MRTGRRRVRALAWSLASLSLPWIAACDGPEAGGVAVEERRIIELMEMRRTGDATGLERIFHPTAVYEDFTSGARYRDLPEIAGFVESFHAAERASFLDVVAYHGGHGMAVAEWVLDGAHTGPGEGGPDSLVLRRFRIDGLTLIELQEGLIVRAADYADPTSLLLAEGAVLTFPWGDTLRAAGESVTGRPPRP